MDFSTPIRRVPATTAPLTTLATISTDSTSPISPNATMNGTQGAIEPVACSLTVSQDCAPSTAPGGSAARTAAISAFTWAVVPALAKRYSICAHLRLPRRAQRGDLRGRHPGLGGLGDRRGAADHGQARRAGHAGHGDLRPDADSRTLAVGQQHDLSQLRRPVARDQREVVDRAVRRGAADHGHLHLHGGGRDRTGRVAVARASSR